MIRLVGHKFIWGALIYVALALASLVFVPRGPLVILLNGLFLGMTVSLSVTLTPLIWRAIRDRSFDEVSQLTFSIVLMWCSLIMLRGNNVWARHYDLGGPTGNNFLIPLSVYFAMGGAFLQISAPGLFEWHTPKGRRTLAWNLALGAVIAALAVWYQWSGDVSR